MAVGQANGRISLLSFYAGGAALKEFGPKTGRACNDLAWNPTFSNYLAAAYEKNRNDHSILVFDTLLSPPVGQTESTTSSAVAKIVSKSTVSKVWFFVVLITLAKFYRFNINGCYAKDPFHNKFQKKGSSFYIRTWTTQIKTNALSVGTVEIVISEQ